MISKQNLRRIQIIKNSEIFKHPMTKTEKFCSLCSCQLFKNNPMTQNFYTCESCNFSIGEYMCEGCAKVCHRSHNVKFVGTFLGVCCCGRKKCHCFLQDPVPGMLNDQLVSLQCSSLCQNSKEEFSTCTVCDPEGLYPLCKCCSLMCHKDHKLIKLPESGNFTCKCLNNHTNSCSIRENSKDNVVICSKFIKDPSHKSDIHRCLTCDCYVCQECALKCHGSHQLVNVQPEESSNLECQCDSSNVHCPLMSNVEPAA